MSDRDEGLDYCQIEFKMRYKGEDFSRAGTKTMWLLFQARPTNNYNYLAGESSEIPIAGNIASASFVPQKNMIDHTSIHQNLLQKLEEGGWEMLPREAAHGGKDDYVAPPNLKNPSSIGLSEIRSSLT